jgi:integrase
LTGLVHDRAQLATAELGTPLDGSKIIKKFQDACRAAGVRVVRCHDLRHTFATRLAASGQPLRKHPPPEPTVPDVDEPSRLPGV